MITHLTGVLKNGSLPRKWPVGARAQPVALARGEDATLYLTVENSDGGPVDLSGSALVLSVKQYAHHDTVLLSRTPSGIAANTAQFAFVPQDTKDWMPGRFIYDVWMTRNGLRDQLVPMSQWLLTPAATSPNQG